MHADSAYRSEEIETMLKKKEMTSAVHEKGYRNNPLTETQKENNKVKSKTRARVEHIFGFTPLDNFHILRGELKTA